MTRCGMPARFPRTGSACWKETSPKRSFRGFWEKHGPGSCSVTNTSRWMEHCWKLGRRTKASGQSILWARITTMFHHRSASHAGPQGTRKGSEIELPRAFDDGESQLTGGEHTGDHGLRFGGVSCRAADGGTVARLRASHVGSR